MDSIRIAYIVTAAAVVIFCILAIILSACNAFPSGVVE